MSTHPLMTSLTMMLIIRCAPHMEVSSSDGCILFYQFLVSSRGFRFLCVEREVSAHQHMVNTHHITTYTYVHSYSFNKHHLYSYNNLNEYDMMSYVNSYSIQNPLFNLRVLSCRRSHIGFEYFSIF